MAVLISSGQISSGGIIDGQCCIQNGGIVEAAAVQYIYLDFDGESTSYRNADLELQIGDVEVEDSKLTPERIAAISAALNCRFADKSVLFVTERPRGIEYSTICVGKTSAFDRYGTFAGLAETVDRGNANRSDNAFVMMDAENSDEEIARTIAHEAEHLIGTLDHGGNGIKRYASYVTELLADLTTLYGEVYELRGKITTLQAASYQASLAYNNNNPTQGVVKNWLVKADTKQEIGAKATASLCMVLGSQVVAGSAVDCYIADGGLQFVAGGYAHKV